MLENASYSYLVKAACNKWSVRAHWNNHCKTYPQLHRVHSFALQIGRWRCCRWKNQGLEVCGISVSTSDVNQRLSSKSCYMKYHQLLITEEYIIVIWIAGVFLCFICMQNNVRLLESWMHVGLHHTANWETKDHIFLAIRAMLLWYLEPLWSRKIFALYQDYPSDSPNMKPYKPWKSGFLGTVWH